MDGQMLSEEDGHKKLATAFLRSGSRLEDSVQRWLRDDENEDENIVANMRMNDSTLDDFQIVYETSWHLAASRCGTPDMQASALYASMGDRIEARNRDECTALHKACRKGNLPMS